MRLETKNNYHVIQQMSGLDQVEVHAALRHWMDLASEQHSILWGYYNLEDILTTEDIPRVENALMIVKQLHARIVDLCDHFIDRPAFNVLESSRKTLETLLEDAKKFAKWSLSFRPNAS